MRPCFPRNALIRLLAVSSQRSASSLRAASRGWTSSGALKCVLSRQGRSFRLSTRVFSSETGGSNSSSSTVSGGDSEQYNALYKRNGGSESDSDSLSDNPEEASARKEAHKDANKESGQKVPINQEEFKEFERTKGIGALTIDPEDDPDFTDRSDTEREIPDEFNEFVPKDIDFELPENFDWMEIEEVPVDIMLERSKRSIKRSKKDQPDEAKEESAEEEEEVEPIQQEEILAFLTSFGMESHATHFTSWQHLMESKTMFMRKAGIPIKERKIILKWVERWKQADRRRSQVYSVPLMWTPPPPQEYSYPKKDRMPTIGWPYAADSEKKHGI